MLSLLGFPDSSAGKESACNAGDPSSIPGSGRSPGEGIDYPLQYSGQENSIDCIVHGILQARILELGAYPFSSRSCRPRNRTGVSCTAGRFFTSWASKEAWTLLLGNRNSPLHPHRARQVSRNHSKTSIKEFCCWQLQVNLVGSEKVGTKGI